MRIRLKKCSIQIEIDENSEYLNYISTAVLNTKCKDKKKELLKEIYYICAKNANYHNPHFFLKLIQSSYKNIVLQINKDESIKKHYLLLKSNEKDSIQVIRKRYLKLAKTYHPDRVIATNANLIEEYTQKFQKIQLAYETVKLKSAS